MWSCSETDWPCCCGVGVGVGVGVRSQARSYYDLESPHEFKKARVLVTGAAGFIGFHICQKLHAVGLPTIVGIDNFNSYYAVELKEGKAS